MLEASLSYINYQTNFILSASDGAALVWFLQCNSLFPNNWLQCAAGLGDG